MVHILFNEFTAQWTLKRFRWRKFAEKFVQESHEKNDLKCTKEPKSRICSPSLEAYFIAIELHHPQKVYAPAIFMFPI